MCLQEASARLHSVLWIVLQLELVTHHHTLFAVKVDFSTNLVYIHCFSLANTVAVPWPLFAQQ